MFTVNNYKVNFEYVHPKVVTKDSRHVTICVIADDKGSVATGIATCNPVDHFSKSEGRKHSLTDALTYLSLTKEERTKFWNAYFQRIEDDRKRSKLALENKPGIEE